MKIKYKIKKFNIEYLANNKIHLVHPTKKLTIELAKYMAENKEYNRGLTFSEIVSFWEKDIVYSINGDGGTWYCIGNYQHLKSGEWNQYRFINGKDVEL